MKKLLFTLFVFAIIMHTGIAQQTLSYHVYVITTSGKVLNKTYKNAVELKSDQTLRDLQVGYLQDEEFIFTPLESKHKAFFVEKSGVNGNEKHVLFEAWDSQAASQIEKAMNIHFGKPTEPIQIQKEKPTTSVVKTEGRKGLEQELLQQLTQDGIIKKDDRKISIVLTRSAFIVNSKKQPLQILTKYKTLVESFRGEQLNEKFRYEYTSEVSD